MHGSDFELYFQDVHSPSLDDFDILYSLAGRTSQSIKVCKKFERNLFNYLNTFLLSDWFTQRWMVFRCL